MQVIRTIAWIVVTAVLVSFIAMNWTRVPVNFWPLDNGNYVHFEWPVGVVALVFFLLGAVPLWLYLRAVRWRLSRRVASLENSLRASSMPAANVTAINARADDAAASATLAPTPDSPPEA